MHSTSQLYLQLTKLTVTSSSQIYPVQYMPAVPAGGEADSDFQLSIGLDIGL